MIKCIVSEVKLVRCNLSEQRAKWLTFSLFIEWVERFVKCTAFQGKTDREGSTKSESGHPSVQNGSVSRARMRILVHINPCDACDAERNLFRTCR